MGLAIFVAVVALNVVGLVLDALLAVTGQTTVTQIVWNRPLVGVPILLVQQVGALGLMFHFYRQ